ncbi:MAG: pyridoxine 5'-phosphate synthase, partial [Verrucomicrobiota bacterium]
LTRFRHEAGRGRTQRPREGEHRRRAGHLEVETHAREGGLDVAGQPGRVGDTVRALAEVGIEVSLFIGPDERQVDAAHASGAPVIELHTGAFAEAWGTPAADAELLRLRRACERAHALGLTVNAGHGINYDNVRTVMTLPWLHELNIGHAIVSRALMTGARTAVSEMKALLRRR